MSRLIVSVLALLLALPAWGINLFAGSQPAVPTEFLPVNQAFSFDFEQQGERLRLKWQISEGYYLYRHQFRFSADGARFSEVILPAGQPHTDEYYGEVDVYRHQLQLDVPLQQATDDATLTVRYQGCADAGLCYPPQTQTLPLSAVTHITPPSAGVPARQADAPPAPLQGEQSRLQQQLLDGGYLSSIGLFFALGLALAFTPCMFPMYPILTGLIAGQGNRLSTRRAFGLSLAYVQGMAITFTLLGLVVATAGMQFQAAMQHPAILIALSLLFVLLALSMFGLYSLQMPGRWQAKLAEWGNRQRGGSLLGVTAMGIISGLVASPCTTAPLSGALLYVAQSGDLLLGGAALYALALGMGLPLLLLGTSGGKLLPKAGSWMERVKALFGFLLLAVPLLLLERLLPELWTGLLWALWLIGLCGYLYHQNQQTLHGWQHSLRAVMILLGLFSGTLLGYHSLTTWPLATASASAPGFVAIKSVADLEQQLQLARLQQQPVMLDFYADWCVACKDFEKYTFSDPQVETKLAQMRLLQADVTANSAEEIALLQRLQVLGLPTLVFFTPQGEEITTARLTGFLDADDFRAHLEQLQQVR